MKLDVEESDIKQALTKYFIERGFQVDEKTTFRFKAGDDEDHLQDVKNLTCVVKGLEMTERTEGAARTSPAPSAPPAQAEPPTAAPVPEAQAPVPPPAPAPGPVQNTYRPRPKLSAGLLERFEKTVLPERDVNDPRRQVPPPPVIAPPPRLKHLDGVQKGAVWQKPDFVDGYIDPKRPNLILLGNGQAQAAFTPEELEAMQAHGYTPGAINGESTTGGIERETVG